MKTLVLGDIHGRTCWCDIILKENPDKIIFLGDYVSTHDKDVSIEQQCSNLEDILNFKEGFGDNCILLRGNHDMQHLAYSWAECSGYFPHVAKWMVSIKDRFLKLTQWLYIEDNIIFSHAGISQDFWNYLNLGEPTKDNILKINDLEPSALFGFTPNKFSDNYGDSTTQPLTWIRPYALIENHILNWIQVVGHTRVKNPGNVFDYMLNSDIYGKWVKESHKTLPELWCVDSLPFKYMIINNNKKEIREYENN